MSVSINASDEMKRELSAEALGHTQVNQEDSPRKPLEIGVRTSSKRPGSMRQSPDKPTGKQGSLKLLKRIKAAAAVLSDPVLWGIGLAKVTHPFMFSIAKDSAGDYALFLKKDLRAHPNQARHFSFSGASNDYFHLFRKEAGMLLAKDLYDVGVNMMGKQATNRLLANVYSESVKQRLITPTGRVMVYQMVDYFERLHGSARVKAIRAVWDAEIEALQSNLNAFGSAVARGFSWEAAALYETFTGKMAQELGFNKKVMVQYDPYDEAYVVMFYRTEPNDSAETLI